MPVIDDKEDVKENHAEEKIESEECESVAKEDVEIEVETSAKVEVVKVVEVSWVLFLFFIVSFIMGIFKMCLI